MGGWQKAGLALAAVMGLAGCGGQSGPFATITPDQAVIEVLSGRPLLACRGSCLDEWRRNQPQAAQLAASARWRELAALVLRVGYQDDLSLYYLGRAAEGLGSARAAASYYRQSQQISGTSLSCIYMSRECSGVVLPAATSVRLATLERAFSRRRSRRGRSPVPAFEEPISAEPITAPLGTEPLTARYPPPPSAPFAMPPPPPPPLIGASPPAGPPPFEYIEPPPAAR